MTTPEQHTSWDWSAYCPTHRQTMNADKTTVHAWADQHNHEAAPTGAASVTSKEET